MLIEPMPAAEPLQDEAPVAKLGFFSTLTTFPRSFWMGCGIEMWERLAYYGTRQVVGLYIAQASDPGGLHFTQDQKGTIFFWWALMASLVPMVSGGFSDRYGYKKSIVASTLITFLGYVLMGTQRSFGGFLAGCLVLAFGTAIFKPGIQGTLAQSMSKRNSSVGWGLFYWLVNFGAMLGPGFAAFMRSHGWSYVFFGSAGIIFLNLPMLLTYGNVESGADTSKKIGRVITDTVGNFFGNPRLILVVVLFSGFWMLLYQLWDLMPNFYSLVPVRLRRGLLAHRHPRFLPREQALEGHERVSHSPGAMRSWPGYLNAYLTQDFEVMGLIRMKKSVESLVPEQSHLGVASPGPVAQQPFQPRSLVASVPAVQPVTGFAVVFWQRAKTQICASGWGDVVVVNGEVQLSLSTPTAERRRTTIPVIVSPDASKTNNSVSHPCGFPPMRYRVFQRRGRRRGCSGRLGGRWHGWRRRQHEELDRKMGDQGREWSE